MLIPEKTLFYLAGLILFLAIPGQAFAQVKLNEILPNPPTGGNEWVEIYNLGTENVNLLGWLLVDNADHTKSLDSLGSLPPTGFAVYEYTGDGWLNNSSPGDTVYLKDNTGTMIDSYSYSSDPGEGKSFGRAPDGGGEWIVFDFPSKGVNNPLPTPTSTPTPTPTSTPTPEPTATPVPEPTNTPAPTSTPKPLTSTPTPKPTLKPTAIVTTSGEILGQEESSPGAFYPWEATGEAKAASSASPSSPSRLLPAVLLGAGFVLLFSAAFWLWYTQLRNK